MTEKVCLCGATFIAHKVGQPTQLCRPCRKKRDREGARRSEQRRLEANPEAIRAHRAELQRAWRARNPGYRNEYETPETKRANKLRRRFGITPEQYDAILKSQRGVCAICEKGERVRARRLAVDHCHRTKRVRGLLCAMCNTAIGKLGDSPKLVRRALEYLEASP